MSELPRSEQDMAFARSFAEEYRGRFFDDPDTLFPALERHLNNYVASPKPFLPADLRRYFIDEIARARRVFDDGSAGILMQKQAGNGFGLDVIVDIFNESARRALSNWGRRTPDEHDEGRAGLPPPAPPLTDEWTNDVTSGPAPVRRATKQDGARSFLTLISDALRVSAGTAHSGGTGVYTANCNLKGWILETWPQFNYSPTRFGSRVTWPVTGTLPTSGNYMFQGLKGASVRHDPTPHYLGPSSAQTLVKL